jgi:hypothetical protein
MASIKKAEQPPPVEYEEEEEETEEEEEEEDEDEQMEMLRLRMAELQNKKKEKQEKKNADIMTAIENMPEYITMTRSLVDIQRDLTELIRDEKETRGYKQITTPKPNTKPNTTTKQKQPTETADIKTELSKNIFYNQNKRPLFGLKVGGVCYDLHHKQGVFYFMDAVPCGKKDNRQNVKLDYDFVIANHLETLNKLTKYIYGTPTNAYTKIIKM